ncbi:hypothetical protein [uncultured Clostridium sp.]|jgi:hypothetical protein|uniref:hypothetical protein n=1 Tax=uncultured Clostridium sp. TaxID=59620 RepID=UPI0026245AB9|nr:hypothetical protein [uncultured Clostridium sp.]
MERKIVLKKHINGMFLSRELYDITTFDGMADTYEKNMTRVWVEVAIALSNVKNTGLEGTDLEILDVFKNTKYTDMKLIISNLGKFKKMKYNIMNLLDL